MKQWRTYLENLLSSLFIYAKTERKGIILIGLIATGILAAVYLTPEKPIDPATLARIDRLSDSIRKDYYEKNFKSKYKRDSTRFSKYANHFPDSGHRQRKPEVYIELNSADSSALTTVRGIGPVISKSIMNYRRKLGGFVRIEQLREVWGITDDNFESISKQFFVDSAVIQKIDINFAPANEMSIHPYMTRTMVDRIVRYRKLKGGWNNLREMIDNDILLPDEARKVSSYVVFR